MNTFLIYLTGNIHSFCVLSTILVVLSVLLCIFYNIDLEGHEMLAERTVRQRITSIIPLLFFMVLTAILPDKETLSAMVSTTVDKTVVEKP